MADDNTSKIVAWLLEDSNPAVKYRTLTEILGCYADPTKTKEWIFNRLPENWFTANGLDYCYYLTALAECGLTAEIVTEKYVEKAYQYLENSFLYGCSDFMLVRALVKLGYQGEKQVQNILCSINANSLSDGGYLCKNRRYKFKYEPKSCYKANAHALFLLSECYKKAITPDFGSGLIKYFLNRAVVYKSDLSGLVYEGKVGWRIIDAFYPFEPMRIGIQNIAEAFAALGYGSNPRLAKVWEFMENAKDETGKLILSGTLTKPYLPKEKVGTPSKWATFYMLLAEKQRQNFNGIVSEKR